MPWRINMAGTYVTLITDTRSKYKYVRWEA
jgi:hypothetical protein